MRALNIFSYYCLIFIPIGLGIYLSIFFSDQELYQIVPEDKSDPVVYEDMVYLFQAVWIVICLYALPNILTHIFSPHFQENPNDFLEKKNVR